MSTHSPAEWAAFTSLGISAWAVMAALLWLTVDAEPASLYSSPLREVADDRHASHSP